MLRRFSANFEIISILLDAVSVLTSLSAAIFAHRWLEDVLLLITHADAHELPGIYHIFFPAMWVLLNLMLNLYDGRRNMRFVDEVSKLVLSTFSATIGLAGLLFFGYPEYDDFLYIEFIVITTGLMLLWRILVRVYWRVQYSHQHELRRILIVGAGDTGRYVAASFSAQFESNLQIRGFLDDDLEQMAQNQDILGTMSDLERIVSTNQINIVVIALPSGKFDLSADIVRRLQLKPVKIWIIPDVHRLALYHSRVDYVSNIPLVDIRAPSISDRQRLVKRLFDLLLSFALSLISAPVMVIIAILVKLDSSGPVFFRQKRVGENTQPFEMLKFRTMVQNAETLCASVERKDEKGNILHKHRNDPRITRVGHFLRRYSLDELPQIYNVLLGQMSLVGPRPELTYLVQNYDHWQYARFTVPQGMTGWWQVNGRSDKPMHLNTEPDLYYIKNYSIWLDIRILWKTVKAVMQGSGAF